MRAGTWSWFQHRLTTMRWNEVWHSAKVLQVERRDSEKRMWKKSFLSQEHDDHALLRWVGNWPGDWRDATRQPLRHDPIRPWMNRHDPFV